MSAPVPHRLLRQPRTDRWQSLALGLLLCVTGCSEPEGAWLEVPGEEPPGLNCLHGGRSLLAGTDDNGNGRLDEDEVRQRTYSCTSPEALSVARAEPPGVNCEFGGTALRTGLDLDGDGLLSDTEGTSIQYVCERAAPTILSRVRHEPAGAACATDGSAVESGLDVDGDGELSREEVTTTRYVCGVRALLRVDPEPPGERCPAGGTVARGGPDLDGDGQLDDVEVESTRYVCDARALTRVDVEPPGPRCPGGGAVVHTGGDTNGDGVLQDTEVRSSETVCERIINGDVWVSTQLELANLQDVTVITGSLYIEGRSVVNVALPALRLVGGQVDLDSLQEVRNLSLPALRSAHSVIVSDSPLLERVSLPALAQTTYVSIARNAALEAVDFEALVSVGDFDVRDNPRLAWLNVPRLWWADDVGLWGLAATRIELPLLYLVKNLYIVDGAAEEVLLPGLSITLGDVVIGRMAGLRQLDLPSLNVVNGMFLVRDTAALTSFSLPRLETIEGHFNLWSNAALTHFDVPLLRGIGGWLDVSFNDSLTTLDGLRSVQYLGNQLTLNGNARLTSLEGLASLIDVRHYFNIRGTALTRLGLPALRRVDRLVMDDNPTLTTLDLPRLDNAISIALMDSPELRELGLPRMRYLLDFLGVWQSPVLPRCHVNGFLEQLDNPVPEVTLWGIDDVSTCE
ncbi:DUF7151 family protein [Corallococcus macrosporus]|uniref:DUF7151 domain-containing protein n=1 Tax=Corallococcus macrosporus DSM 14697 TaxID=1189310 RepID=A0A250JX68_9BACT|nr:hypothetical protein [Corallococcus macrosporus]ATB48210.1 hypothetical protein MYMAC_003836 [Corallococcus macrosporus DSM 14697]